MLNPDFRDILSEFNAKGVEYLLVGAYAVAVHGLPRATGDIDLWIRPAADNAKATLLALESFGASLDLLAPADFETPDRVVQLGVSPRRVDLLTSIDGIDFDTAWRDASPCASMTSKFRLSAWRISSPISARSQDHRIWRTPTV